MPGAIITLIMCTINDKHIMCGFRDKERKRQFFVILGYFLPFYPTNNLQNHNLKKNNKKKTPGDKILLLLFYKCVP